jgi:hypothetical protein
MKRRVACLALVVACGNGLPLEGDGGTDATTTDVVSDTPATDAPADSGPSDAGSDVVLIEAGLRTFATAVSAYAVDDANVYFADANKNAIVVCPHTGCSSSPTVLATGQLYVPSIALDSTTVYWTNTTVVRSCAKNGCNQNPTDISTPQTNFQPSLVATDGTNVYFTTNNGVFYCSVGGCGGVPPGIASTMQNVSITAQGGYTYWSSQIAGSVFRCSAPCNSGPTLEADASYPWGVAVDSTNLWFTGRGIVASCPLTGCNGASTPIASPPFPGYIAVDGTNAYFWNQGYPDAASHTDIFRCAKSGCGGNPTSLATEPSYKNLSTISVDGQSVYWVADGALMQLTPK